MAAHSIRIGLVGYGKGGRYFHAPLIEQAAGCRLVGVVTRSPERRSELASDLPHVPAYSDVLELANAGVDALTITTPLRTHRSLVEEAIGLGLPVVCDKPLAENATVGREVVEAAQRAGVLFSVYQNRRWDADYLTVRKVVASGELGEVISFESRMEQFPPEDGIPTSGGGALLDLGSHAVDQALRLFGPIASIYAEARFVAALDGIDDRFFLAALHGSGVVSHLTGNWAVRGDPPARFRIGGSEASLVVPGDDGQSDRLLAGRTPAIEGSAFGTVPEAGWGHLFRDGQATPVPAEVGAWHSFYAAFAAAVRGEGAVPVDPWDAVAALEVLDAARASAVNGQVVSLR